MEQAQASVVSLHCVGDLDFRAADGLVAEIGATTADVILLDMSGVWFTDSTGLSALVRLHWQLAHDDRTLRLVHVPPRLGRLLDLTGLDQILDVDTTESEPV